MARVTVEDCLEYVPNRFKLVKICSQRAKQLLAGAPIVVDYSGDNKEIVMALREIAEGAVSIMGEAPQTEVDDFTLFAGDYYAKKTEEFIEADPEKWDLAALDAAPHLKGATREQKKFLELRDEFTCQYCGWECKNFLGNIQSIEDIDDHEDCRKCIQGEKNKTGKGNGLICRAAAGEMLKPKEERSREWPYADPWRFEMEAEHIRGFLPFLKNTVVSNMLTSCAECHKARAGRTVGEFLDDEPSEHFIKDWKKIAKAHGAKEAGGPLYRLYREWKKTGGGKDED